MQKTINNMVHHLTESEIDKLISQEPEITIKDYLLLIAEIEAISESVKEAA